ncbi:MAG TPA: RNA-binding transcriptional accessory protein, partial [Bacteroidales bacterium]|nr:RNA-binding transcriptional accessory protein [Bacteroidales bacterium]
MTSPFSPLIAKELNLTEQQVENTINLLQEGASIPFIARYRKELTGSLNEVSIIGIRDRLKQLTELEKRRESVIRSISEQGKLTEELERALREAITLSEIEDLYLPYRPKRKTRASEAIEKGLEPLAKILLAQKENDIIRSAKRFIDVDKGVADEDEALQGARDIIAEWVNQDAVVRQRLRMLFRSEAVISSRLVKGKDEEAQKYRSWFQWEEEVRRIPS